MVGEIHLDPGVGIEAPDHPAVVHGLAARIADRVSSWDPLCPEHLDHRRREVDTVPRVHLEEKCIGDVAFGSVDLE
ncbi:MAG: hypothetical protein U5K37_13225 [Natrialbaceae archaeon]|nr:hypothetical protein [Natrialbaceae archaeon]